MTDETQLVNSIALLYEQREEALADRRKLEQELGAAMSTIEGMRRALDAQKARSTQAEADYVMLRAVARRCFAENTNDQDMLNLWTIAATEDHPGRALIIRFNRMKTAIARACEYLPGRPDQAERILSEILGKEQPHATESK